MLDISIIQNNIEKDIKVVCKQTTLSTNLDVKNHINTKKERCVYIAEEQTQGRGRIGHDFISPKGGIYMSLYVDRNNIQDEYISLITPIAAVAVAKAIYKNLNKQVDIKWINDLLYKDKKVCGILAEAIVLDNTIQGIVIGIGIDLKIDTLSLDNGLKGIVGTLLEKDEEMGSKEALISDIVNNIYYLISKLPDIEFLDYYRSHCVTIGKDISYYINNEKHFGRAIGVLNNGMLQVEEKTGVRVLDSGEVFNIR